MGWKPELVRAYGAVWQRFKSHHSGMETTLRIRLNEYLQFFKSHHSGMETVTNPAMSSWNITLNRTIVGWKPAPGGCHCPPGPPFKSHHSGMETVTMVVFDAVGGAFKSHHSGMETEELQRFLEQLRLML